MEEEEQQQQKEKEKGKEKESSSSAATTTSKKHETTVKISTSTPQKQNSGGDNCSGSGGDRPNNELDLSFDLSFNLDNVSLTDSLLVGNSGTGSGSGTGTGNSASNGSACTTTSRSGSSSSLTRLRPQSSYSARALHFDEASASASASALASAAGATAATDSNSLASLDITPSSSCAKGSDTAHSSTQSLLKNFSLMKSPSSGLHGSTSSLHTRGFSALLRKISYQQQAYSMRTSNETSNLLRLRNSLGKSAPCLTGSNYYRESSSSPLSSTTTSTAGVVTAAAGHNAGLCQSLSANACNVPPTARNTLSPNCSSNSSTSGVSLSRSGSCAAGMARHNVVLRGSVSSASSGVAQHRLSLVTGGLNSAVAAEAAAAAAANNSRAHSPHQTASPGDSPRINSPMQFPVAAPLKRIAGCRTDVRRWSLASLPSSGYGTTPGSSNLSSQCSSQEGLNAQASEEQQSAAGGACCSEHLQLAKVKQNSLGSGSMSPLVRVPSPLVKTTSVSAVIETEDCQMHAVASGRTSPFNRPRSRSLSSPSRAPYIEHEIAVMNTLYKERFPKATQQMEERLKIFINENKSAVCNSFRDSQPVMRFVHHQVLEMARDCLQKSESKLITSQYFYELSDNLEHLLLETKEKSPEAAAELTGIIKRLLLIISRPARLLECLEFDPEEFYHLLEAAEGQAKCIQGIKADIPQYIIEKLGLNRDPIEELQQELKETHELCDKPLLANANTCQNSPDLSQLNLGGGMGTPVGGGALLPQKPPQTPVDSMPSFATAVCAQQNTANMAAMQAQQSTTPIAQQQPSPNEHDFEIVKLISNGAYGAVYLVKHTTTRQRFAMKKINKNNLILRNQVEQVFAERDILSFADNPFVVSMYCSFETKKHLCLVMEYVEGGDCGTLIKNIGPLPADMARFYFAETVLAVEYLHSYGIVHRDLKPDNLLITALGHIKLTDFGLSKMGLMSLATNLYEGYIDSDTRQFSDKQVYGTPEYIAPEVILRQGYGKPVDWWSMGIILYEFLIGCVPFFGETAEELFAHTVNDDIEWPDNDDWSIQTEAKDIITQLLQQNPRDRLGTQTGALEVKEHVYFDGLDWNSLLRQKAEFVPQLASEEDTSYFDSRLDRYNHDLAGEDTDDTADDAPVFGSFTSCTPQYRRQHYSWSRSPASANSSANSSAGLNISTMADSSARLSESDSSNASLSAAMPKPKSNYNEPLEQDRNMQKFLTTPQLRKIDLSATCLKVPSTPDADYLPEILHNANVGDGNDARMLRHYLHQPSPLANSDATKCNVAPRNPIMPPNNANIVMMLSTPPITTTKNSTNATPSSASLAAKQPIERAQALARSTPESSQTDSDELSPQIYRKRKGNLARDGLPRFSISIEDEPVSGCSKLGMREQSPLVLHHQPKSMDGSVNNAQFTRHHRSRPIVKSASALGLSLMSSVLDGSQLTQQIADITLSGLQSPAGCGGNGSSTASSRDTSPCRELSPLVTNLKPPIVIKRGPRGFGFTVHTIRVYYGDTDFYTMHHLVMAVDEGSPAFEAGLRPADLITHVNGEAVQGLYHTQVLQLLLSGGENATLRATPLEHTSIQSGGRKRDLMQSKLAKKGVNRQRKQSKKEFDKKRKTSLFRRISSKRASAELQQFSTGAVSPTTPSGLAGRNLSPMDSSYHSGSCGHSAGNSSTSSTSPSSSSPNTPTSSASNATNATLMPAQVGAIIVSSATSTGNLPVSPTSAVPQLYQRPSTLHGLKHKLHTSSQNAICPSANGALKSIHTNAATSSVPNRRKSVGHIPLSPLARTPSPSPLPSSPTRSPSPLAFPIFGHQPGASNTTQSYSPGTTLPSVAGAAGKKGGFVRTKSIEPSSPLLRRALSPDRLHPRSAETKCTLISPLCCSSPPVKQPSQQRAVSGVWRTNSAGGGQSTISAPNAAAVEEHAAAAIKAEESSQVPESATGLALTLTTGEPLPRIAEEKDSPTGTQDSSLAESTTIPQTSEEANVIFNVTAKPNKAAEAGKEKRKPSK